MRGVDPPLVPPILNELITHSIHAPVSTFSFTNDIRGSHGIHEAFVASIKIA